MILRRATPGDAPACAAIVRRWIEATPWLRNGPSRDTLEMLMREGFPIREAWIAEAEGATLGYLSLRPDEDHVVGLYAARPGRGVGKALLDRVKTGRVRLQLDSHEPNRAAHRFYEREGFQVVERGRDGADGVPELRMEWRR